MSIRNCIATVILSVRGACRRWVALAAVAAMGVAAATPIAAAQSAEVSDPAGDVKNNVQHAHLGTEGFDVVDVNDSDWVPWPQD